MLFVKRIDIIDSILLLDIKSFNVGDAERSGWMERKRYNISKTKDDERFIN